MKFFIPKVAVVLFLTTASAHAATLTTCQGQGLENLSKLQVEEQNGVYSYNVQVLIRAANHVGIGYGNHGPLQLDARTGVLHAGFVQIQVSKEGYILDDTAQGGVHLVFPYCQITTEN